MTDKELDCRNCFFWELGPLKDSEMGKCSHSEVGGDLLHPRLVTPCRFFASAESPLVVREMRCPRCMGDGKHYVELSPGSPQIVDEEPCPDCKGEGEGNVDVFLDIYMARAQKWKNQADQFEAILKRIARSKEGGGLQGLLQAADDQRLRRVEKSARELVRELRQLDEAPEGLPALEWALMGGDPEVE